MSKYDIGEAPRAGDEFRCACCEAVIDPEWAHWLTYPDGAEQLVCNVCNKRGCWRQPRAHVRRGGIGP